MKRPFLTIYIPSFQRPVSLEIQLSTLLDQLEQARVDPSLIQIIVSLNGIEENRDQLDWLYDLEASSGYIKIRCNSFNIGGNANIALGFTVGRQEGYLWILSDDDILPSGCIVKVLTCLQQFSPDVLILTSVPEICHCALNYNDIRDFEQTPLITLGLVSRGVYSVRYISASSDIPFSYHNSSFPHLAAILGALKKNTQCSITFLPIPEFLNSYSDVKENPGDYSLSLAGRSQLLQLLPRLAKRVFAHRILRSGSLDLLRVSRRYPSLVASSLLILLISNPISFVLIPWFLLLQFCNRASKKLVLSGLHSSNGVIDKASN